VERLKEMPPYYYNLILMDIQMPDMNGYEATQAIRKMEEPGKSDIPILAMTANAFEEDKRNAFSAGMDGHLGKPIIIDDLMKALSDVLKSSAETE
jgi:CheY-like chemotaxis protein